MKEKKFCPESGVCETFRKSSRHAALAAMLLLLATAPPIARSGEKSSSNPSITPIKPARHEPADPRDSHACFPRDFRTIDGYMNNLRHPEWGSAEMELRRVTTVDYGDGADTPSGANRPGARAISNAVAAQEQSLPNSRGLSDMFWQWGQFIDHDLDLTAIIAPAEPFDIPVPAGDPQFDPGNTGTQVIGLNRSFYNHVDGVRQQVNELTAYLDASMVYGSDYDRARELRARDGTGRLKTSAGHLLPFNVNGLPNAPNTDPAFFLAGDVRSNEQVGLTAMHTLFVREHNRWAAFFRREHRRASDEMIYQLARAMVAAEVQCVTYNEFLPLLLGPSALAPYCGYRPHLNPGIMNEFSTAAFRFGHTLLSPQLLRLDRFGRPIPAGNLALRDAFFAPQEIVDHGIDSLLRGLCRQRAQEFDQQIVDDVRNFLFGPPGAGGFDLAALNIQRGRDHGLPGLNQVRADFGLPRFTGFDQLSAIPAVQDDLAAVYNAVDDVDLWIGGLAEDNYRAALPGRTFYTILKKQFENLRDGDRFWYECYLPERYRRMVEQCKLSVIIRENTGIGRELQANALLVPRH